MPPSNTQKEEHRHHKEEHRHHQQQRRMSSPLQYLALIVASLAILTVSTGYFTYPPPTPSSCSCVQDTTANFGVSSLTSDVIPDCCCSYGTVNALNHEALFPILQTLVRTPFFKYFKTNLRCDCPFWPDDGMCNLRDCTVCECPDGEFPELFKSNAGSDPQPRLPADNLLCQEGKPQGMVDRTIDQKPFTGWAHRDNPWTLDDETDDQREISYVNLLLNPERFTGYRGTSARRIWNAIYNDNALLNQSNNAGAEGRVLHKLISGLHSSISIHIAAEYLLDDLMDVWGPNTGLLYDRILDHPDRIRNLYFCYLFVLRAVTKAGDYLLQADYRTGNRAEDDNTHATIMQLVKNERLRAACPKPFDEAQLWKGADGEQLLLQLQGQFRNISALMDCVGCEKCRLWGKLQVLGLGTALEILLSDVHQPLLQRNDVIALINLLNRLSESLHFLQELAPTVLESLVLQPVSHGHARER